MYTDQYAKCHGKHFNQKGSCHEIATSISHGKYSPGYTSHVVFYFPEKEPAAYRKLQIVKLL